ncbi:hypothetical protein HSBAA_45310 [Vreelandella sulfidaeris]|uniref:Uncharacterized protein n=1 Tax=Vreelandella sulfidaeris TaxID=115553 RepID=A0A455UB17_9GAMM|nr:hypothetical protein HSBAA_45310 [Halomonas sulfidaeris]
MVVLARSLADVTRQAKEVSNSEIATLVTGSIEGNSIAQARQLDAWNGHLVALTHEELSLALLQRAATIVPVQRLIEEPLSLQHNGRNLELSAVYMGEDTTSSNAGYFLLISDITDQLKAINQDTRTLLVAGVIGWLAAELYC